MQIKVKCSTEYLVTVTHGKSEFYNAVSPFIKGQKVLIISDGNVDGLYSDYFDGLLNGFTVLKYVVKAGENSKNFDNYIKIVNFLAENKFCRSDTVIAFGGGVIGDLAGFIASTFMRGITLVCLPTTLLSIIDSSVGGKTGINIDYGKNLCGTFYQPSCVYIDLDFLKTLPQEQVKCGMGEMIKYTFIDKKLCLENLSVNQENICECLKYKAKIVKADEREKGKRKLLNFGHTFGHAIEKLSGFSISHGECVIKGINFALILSEKILGSPQKTRDVFNAKCKELGLDYSCGYDVESLVEIIKNDKKAHGDYVDTVLIDKADKPKIISLDLSKIKGVL